MDRRKLYRNFLRASAALSLCNSIEEIDVAWKKYCAKVRFAPIELSVLKTHVNNLARDIELRELRKSKELHV